jgi:tetratricopeptide (TPR) repeat protein
MKGEVARAIDSLNQAFAANQDDIMACFTLGCAYNISGNTEEACRMFNRVISRYSQLTSVKPRFAEGHYYMGRSYYLMGNLQKAREHLLQAVEFDTEEVDFHYSFGMLYSDADAFGSLAEVQHDLGQHEEARNSLKKALALEPANKRFLELKSSIGI